MIKSQKEKEDAVYLKVNEYRRHGYKKSAAVRKVMEEFMYSTEAAIYGILKRVEERNKL